MSHLETTTTRHKVSEIGNQLSITIPSQKEWFENLLLTLASAMVIKWAADGINVVRNTHYTPDIRGFLLFILWAYMGASTLHAILWTLFGYETVIINGQNILTHRWEILGIKEVKNYKMALVRDLRVAQVPVKGRRSIYSQRLQRYRVVAFNYGNKTIRIGDNLDEAEAKQIVHILYQHISSIDMGQHPYAAYRVEISGS